MLNISMAGNSRPEAAARRRDRLVTCATALIRYLPEALRLQLGLSCRWRYGCYRSTIGCSAVIGQKAILCDRLLLAVRPRVGVAFEICVHAFFAFLVLAGLGERANLMKASR